MLGFEYVMISNTDKACPGEFTAYWGRHKPREEMTTHHYTLRNEIENKDLSWKRTYT